MEKMPTVALLTMACGLLIACTNVDIDIVKDRTLILSKVSLPFKTSSSVRIHLDDVLCSTVFTCSHLIKSLS